MAFTMRERLAKRIWNSSHYPEAVQWSIDGQIAVLTSEGAHIFTPSFNGTNTFNSKWIQVSTNAKKGPEIASSGNTIVCCEDLVSWLSNQASTSELGLEMVCLSWSPPGLCAGYSCCLALLGNDGALLIINTNTNRDHEQVVSAKHHTKISLVGLSILIDMAAVFRAWTIEIGMPLLERQISCFAWFPTRKQSIAGFEFLPIALCSYDTLSVWMIHKESPDSGNVLASNAGWIDLKEHISKRKSSSTSITSIVVISPSTASEIIVVGTNDGYYCRFDVIKTVEIAASVNVKLDLKFIWSRDLGSNSRVDSITSVDAGVILVVSGSSIFVGNLSNQFCNRISSLHTDAVTGLADLTAWIAPGSYRKSPDMESVASNADGSILNQEVTSKHRNQQTPPENIHFVTSSFDGELKSWVLRVPALGVWGDVVSIAGHDPAFFSKALNSKLTDPCSGEASSQLPGEFSVSIEDQTALSSPFRRFMGVASDSLSLVTAQLGIVMPARESSRETQSNLNLLKTNCITRLQPTPWLHDTDWALDSAQAAIVLRRISFASDSDRIGGRCRSRPTAAAALHEDPDSGSLSGLSIALLHSIEATMFEEPAGGFLSRMRNSIQQKQRENLDSGVGDLGAFCLSSDEESEIQQLSSDEEFLSQRQKAQTKKKKKLALEKKKAMNTTDDVLAGTLKSQPAQRIVRSSSCDPVSRTLVIFAKPLQAHMGPSLLGRLGRAMVTVVTAAAEVAQEIDCSDRTPSLGREGSDDGRESEREREESSLLGPQNLHGLLCIPLDALQRRRKERLWRCLHQLLLAPWGAVRASLTSSIDLFPPDIDAHVLLGQAPPEASSSSSSSSSAAHSSGKVATALGVNEQQARELAGQLRRVMQVAIAMDSVYRLVEYLEAEPVLPDRSAPVMTSVEVDSLKLLLLLIDDAATAAVDPSAPPIAMAAHQPSVLLTFIGDVGKRLKTCFLRHESLSKYHIDSGDAKPDAQIQHKLSALLSLLQSEAPSPAPAHSLAEPAAHPSVSEAWRWLYAEPPNEMCCVCSAPLTFHPITDPSMSLCAQCGELSTRCCVSLRVVSSSFFSTCSQSILRCPVCRAVGLFDEVLAPQQIPQIASPSPVAQAPLLSSRKRKKGDIDAAPNDIATLLREADTSQAARGLELTSDSSKPHSCADLESENSKGDSVPQSSPFRWQWWAGKSALCPFCGILMQPV